ncbi:DUF4457-containing protein [Aureococcus anophagefferens]|nr:DUF4457-containing protein [Aureococcus anophagefferens]
MMMQVPVDGPPSPKTAAHMEYLRRLEEATKLKKPRKSAKPVRLAKKEAGFDLHWAGANRQRTGGKLKKAARPLAALAPPENARRTWGRTAAPAAAAPPTKSDDEYDDDFDERRRARGGVGRLGPRRGAAVAGGLRADRRARRVQAGRAKAADDGVVEATPEAAPAPAEAVVEEAPAEAAAEAVVEAVVEVPPAIAPPAIAPPAIAPPAIAPPAIAPPAIAPRAEPFVATVRIRNGWGNARIAGLDGLALVGGDGAVIEVAPDALRLLAGSPPRPAPASSRSAAELARLTAPPASRRRDLAAKSWVARIPTDGPHVALAVGAGVLDRAGARLRVWNCSASAKAIGGVADEPGALGARSIEGSGWFDVALTAPAAVPAELAAAAPTPAAEAAPTPAEEAPPAPKPAPRDAPATTGGAAAALVTPDDAEASGIVADASATLPTPRAAALDLASPPKPKPTPRSRRPRTQGPEEPEDDEAAPAEAAPAPAAPRRAAARRTLSQVLGRARRGAPRELPRRKPRNEASLLESWDSLAQFSSKSGRGSRAGASALGDSFADSVAGAPGDADSFVEDDDDEVFEGVPTLPSGRVLTLFDDRGAPVAPVAIAATPSMEGHDPRTPENLCDGVYDTSDELRAWLCPFDAAEPPTVTLELAPASQPPTTLAMLRLWNYNASRTASRGARFLRCFLDGVKIFEGEAEKDEEDEALDRLLEVARPSTADRLEDSVADEAPVVARDAGEAAALASSAAVPNSNLQLDFNVHNYNKSPRTRGARTLVVEADGAPLRTVELRPAPGRAVDFGQLVSFDEPPAAAGPARAAPLLGRPYYVGLDGIRLVGEDGREIPVDARRVDAVPRSVRVLGAGFADDARLPANLFSGKRGVPWLAPNLCSYAGEAQLPEENELFVFLDAPRRLAGVALTNYAKTPSRGVRELSLFVDGVLVSRNVLKRADEVAPGEAQHVLFTHDRHDRRPANVEPQDVLCIDENQVRVRSKAMFEPDRALGKFETVDLAARPATSVVR